MIRRISTKTSVAASRSGTGCSALEVKGFGVDANRADAHTLWGELIAPFGNAGLRLKELLGRAPQATPLPAPDQPRA